MIKLYDNEVSVVLHSKWKEQELAQIKSFSDYETIIKTLTRAHAHTHIHTERHNFTKDQLIEILVIFRRQRQQQPVGYLYPRIIN